MSGERPLARYPPTQAKLETLVRRIVEIAHPLRIILFGSAARGLWEPGRDVDLLIVVPEGTPRRRTAQGLYRHLSGAGVPFDLLVTTPALLNRHRDNPGLIYRTILEEGIESMPAETTPPGTPEDWLRHARSDLALCRGGRAEGVLLEMLCFHAQQAAEKALKAVLVAKGVPTPRTHNIRTLLDGLPEFTPFPQEVLEAAGLTDYAVTARYPGDEEPLRREDYLEALKLAEAVVAWASEQIGMGKT